MNAIFTIINTISNHTNRRITASTAPWQWYMEHWYMSMIEHRLSQNACRNFAFVWCISEDDLSQLCLPLMWFRVIPSVMASSPSQHQWQNHTTKIISYCLAMACKCTDISTKRFINQGLHSNMSIQLAGL